MNKNHLKNIKKNTEILPQKQIILSSKKQENSFRAENHEYSK